jgi:SPOR domain
MINVGASSSTPEAEQTVARTAQEEPKERVPLMAIPITLAIGLLVAAGYVGNRILVSRGHATPLVAASPAPAVAASNGPGVASARQPQSAPAPAAQPVKEAAAGVARSADIPIPPAEKRDRAALNPDSADNTAPGLIAPQPGERYLQIAAISADMVTVFLADLRKYDVNASVAPGPHDGLVRIVVGPFADRDSVGRAKDQIQAKWPDCFVRLY